MGLVRRSRKSPLLDPGHLAQPGKLAPALTQIVAVEEMGRLRSRVEPRPPFKFLASQRINPALSKTLVSPLPVLVSVPIGINGAAIGSRKEHSARRLKKQGADVLARQQPSLGVP